MGLDKDLQHLTLEPVEGSVLEGVADKDKFCPNWRDLNSHVSVKHGGIGSDVWSCFDAQPEIDSLEEKGLVEFRKFQPWDLGHYHFTEAGRRVYAYLVGLTDDEVKAELDKYKDRVLRTVAISKDGLCIQDFGDVIMREYGTGNGIKGLRETLNGLVREGFLTKDDTGDIMRGYKYTITAPGRVLLSSLTAYAPEEPLPELSPEQLEFAEGVLELLGNSWKLEGTATAPVITAHLNFKHKTNYELIATVPAFRHLEQGRFLGYYLSKEGLLKRYVRRALRPVEELRA